MYIRFVVGSDRENGAWLTSVITEARLLDDTGLLYRHESEQLRYTFDWFNANLPCPPFSSKLRTGDWTRNAVSWFRPEAGEPITRIWDLIALLNEHGNTVRMIRVSNPGKIVYKDRYQVVAETPY